MQTAFAQHTPRSVVSRHRGGGIEFQRLLTGPPGSENTFELSIIHIADGYATPRHHHNFDQLRLGLTGIFNYARDKHIRTGDVLYVPEGTWYGPHRNDGDAELMLIQYGGNTGSGFLTYEELADGFARLESRGRFENGVFRPTAGDTGSPAGPARNQDGYEAIWETVKGVPVAYPTPRYSEPILMHTEAFQWVPDRDTPELMEKNLGVFGERRNEVRMLRLLPGRPVKLGTDGCVDLGFVLTGAVTANGVSLAARDALSLAPDDGPIELVAQVETELFWTVLPDFS